MICLATAVDTSTSPELASPATKYEGSWNPNLLNTVTTSTDRKLWRSLLAGGNAISVWWPFG